ncbi:sensor domain-containing protein [Mycolicibacterium chubuense]|uniref:sensor domain-containing protein n=1 Tax=Mycolicibacterium chubuense TaxID=1800 RepID=UPI0002F24306|nr:sensor domain-containing protein [Mycolicibacterium chubuense]
MTRAAATRHVGAVGVLTVASLLLAGCANTVGGTAVRGAGGPGQRDIAPLDEASLDRILLGIGELNGIVGSTQMTVTSSLEEMTDHSAGVSDPACLGAIYGAEEPVYAGTGWTAVRDRVAREPTDDNDHWVEQTAVLYPAAQNAQDFFGHSSDTWQKCANRSVDVGDGEYTWQLGDAEAGDAMLTQTTSQNDSGGWACQHALSLVSNVTVEAWSCGYSVTDEAVQIADAMIKNAGGK